MLGSHFDLTKEVAAIAARRELESGRLEPDRSGGSQVFDAFDRTFRDFLSALGTSDLVNGREARSVSPVDRRRILSAVD